MLFSAPKEFVAKLPPIFRFSTLCNILPFFGTLEKWSWLLSCLSSKTKSVWEDNEQMFLYCGQNFKREIIFDLAEDFDRAREWFNSKYIFYKHFLISQSDLYNLKKLNIPEYGQDKVLIVEKSDNEYYEI